MNPKQLRYLLLTFCLMALATACSRRRQTPPDQSSRQEVASRTLPPPPPSTTPPLPAPSVVEPANTAAPETGTSAAAPTQAVARVIAELPLETTPATTAPAAEEPSQNDDAEAAAAEAAEAAPTAADLATEAAPAAADPAAEKTPDDVATAEIAAAADLAAEAAPAAADPAAEIAAAADLATETAPAAADPAAEAAPAVVLAEAAETAIDPPSLRPTEWVRIRVTSGQPNDTFLPRAIKHLYLGRQDLLPLPGCLFEIPYSRVSEAPLTLRVQHYEVVKPTLQATPFAPSGVCEVVFSAIPHPATVQLLDAPPDAEIWRIQQDRPTERISLASRHLWFSPFEEHMLEVRAIGLQPLRIVLPSSDPATILPDLEVRCLPLPLTARPGQSCRIVLPGGCDLSLTWVPGGRVVLQDPRFAGAPPDVRVETLPRGFWMAKTEITRAQWMAVRNVGDAPDTNHPLLPQTGISWEDASRFAQHLTRLVPRGTARLPSESEWEHAASAGRDDPYGRVPPASIRHVGNSAGRPSEADSGHPNPWNLYHLSGNVREWCADTFAPYRASGRHTGPLRRVVRGGGFRNALLDCQVFLRDAEPPDRKATDLGFRIVIVPAPPPPPHALVPRPAR